MPSRYDLPNFELHWLEGQEWKSKDQLFGTWQIQLCFFTGDLQDTWELSRKRPFQVLHALREHCDLGT